jgi:hypothetical protein
MVENNDLLIQQTLSQTKDNLNDINVKIWVSNLFIDLYKILYKRMINKYIFCLVIKT